MICLEAKKWQLSGRKKGTSFIRPSPKKKYQNMRQLLFRMINQVTNRGGHLFYYGREKENGKLDGNPIGLYTTILAHALRSLDAYCEEVSDNFVVVVDQHSARKELLECAAKTMFGIQPCRRLSSPPFEVESYLNQNIQAADWIATLVGRVAAFEVCPEEFPDYKHIDTLFSDRLRRASRRSGLMRRPFKPPWRKKRPSKEFESQSPFAELMALKIRRQ